MERDPPRRQPLRLRLEPRRRSPRYVLAGRVKEAVMTFEVMDLYGCSRDVVALNSLLSAICRDGRTVEASDFLRVAQRHIRPDSDSFAILLEGWEKEMNVVCSRETFAEMIEWVGWDRGNVPAYDAFLCTLLMEGIIEPLKYLEVMKSKGCCPGIRFLASAVEECSKRGDIISADSVWETMVDGFRIRPDARLHSMMIELHCCSRNTDRAVKLFDETVRAGLFPNVQACNMLFELLIEARRLKEGSALVNEMMRNEYALTQTNCSRAVMIYLESRDAYMAILIWKLMVERYKSDLEETGNGLVVGLIDLQFAPEAVVYAEGMIEKGIKLTLPTISKLKESLIRERKEIVFEKLLRKWTSSHG
ncbi:Pentatricopeptide repeat-containing protein At1g77360, mitochondrial [Linum perenne]